MYSYGRIFLVAKNMFNTSTSASTPWVVGSRTKREMTTMPVLNVLVTMNHL